MEDLDALAKGMDRGRTAPLPKAASAAETTTNIGIASCAVLILNTRFSELCSQVKRSSHASELNYAVSQVANVILVVASLYGCISTCSWLLSD